MAPANVMHAGIPAAQIEMPDSLKNDRCWVGIRDKLGEGHTVYAQCEVKRWVTRRIYYTHTAL